MLPGQTWRQHRCKSSLVVLALLFHVAILKLLSTAGFLSGARVVILLYKSVCKLQCVSNCCNIFILFFWCVVE